MVKIFVGNLGDEADAEKLKKLFEEYGAVTECDVLNRFGFVHMDSESAARTAIDNLHHSLFEGKQINVELSTGGAPHRPREGRGGGRGGGRGRERGGRGDRYDPYPPPPRGYYDDPYERRRDPYDRRPPARDPYRDPYYDRDPYGRYPPPERDPYARYPPPERDPYYRRRDPYGRPPPPYEADPYARPPPEYYYEHISRTAERPPPPHYDPYYEQPPERRPDQRADYPPESAEADAYPPQPKKEYDASAYADSAAPAEGYGARPPWYRGRGGGGKRRGGAVAATGANGHYNTTDPTSLYMSFE